VTIGLKVKQYRLRLHSKVTKDTLHKQQAKTQCESFLDDKQQVFSKMTSRGGTTVVSRKNSKQRIAPNPATTRLIDNMA
jgi:hypothetical protein